jgi:hypothetical protein
LDSEDDVDYFSQQLSQDAPRVKEEEPENVTGNSDDEFNFEAEFERQKSGEKNESKLFWSRNYQPVSCHRQNRLWNKHSPGKKTYPIKLLGTRQHLKLGSRQQAGNSVFFLFHAAGKNARGIYT